MPYLLQAALHCEKYGISPGVLGFAEDDPRVYRSMSMARNVYEAGQERKRHKAMSKAQERQKRKKGRDKPDWERDYPEAAKTLRWAASYSKAGKGVDPENPALVAIEIPVKKN